VRLKAVALDVLLDQLLQLLDVSLLLSFCATPEFLQVGSASGVGDVLVLSPETIQPPAQVVNQIVIMIFDPARLAKVFVFLVCHHRHATFSFFVRCCQYLASVPPRPAHAMDSN